jgi:cystathionine beta-synthase
MELVSSLTYQGSLRQAHTTILTTIGNTPLIRLPLDTPACVYAKLEHLNPGGSIKDRSALYMIQEAERTGKLQPNGSIIEASSGNQGIAAAMIGAVKGYKVIVTVSEKVSFEKKSTLQAYGAEVVVCPITTHLTDPASYHSKALQLHKEIPNSFLMDQYFNRDNLLAHYYWTGPEIWRQTQGKITHLCVAAGTGGTVSGIGKFLKEQNPAIQVLAVDALTSYRATGGNPLPYKIEGLGIDFDAPLVDTSVIDQFLLVSDEEAAGMLKELAIKHGLLVGPASAAAAYATRAYAKTLTPADTMITIFTDSGRAYLTKNFS